MKNEKDYKQILRELWGRKKWISNADYAAATGGSPKFTSRVSDLRRAGWPIIDRWVENESGGRHKEYALEEETA